MSVINKLKGTELPQLPVHQFGWAMTLWLTGDINKATALAFLQATAPDFVPTAAEQTQMDNVQAKYNAFTNLEKVGFIAKFEPATEAMRLNVITVAVYKTIMGIAED